MVYQFKFLHVFMSLFFFYIVMCLLTVGIHLAIVARPLFFDIISNQYIWMLYAPMPLFIGMCSSLFYAAIIHWIYRCRVEGHTLTARDTLGRKLHFESKDIESIRTYHVPFMPLSRLKIAHQKWSAWIPKEAMPTLHTD